VSRAYQSLFAVIFFMKFIDTFFEESVDELHEKYYYKGIMIANF